MTKLPYYIISYEWLGADDDLPAVPRKHGLVDDRVYLSPKLVENYREALKEFRPVIARLQRAIDREQDRLCREWEAEEAKHQAILDELRFR